MKNFARHFSLARHHCGMKSQLSPATILCSVILLLMGTMTTRVMAAPPSYQLNENIEVSTTGAWDKATIIEVGVAGTENEGKFKVHFVGYGPNYDRWLLPSYFRKVAGGMPAAGAAGTAPSAAGSGAAAGAAATNAAGGPRAGKYNISSYGA